MPSPPFHPTGTRSRSRAFAKAPTVAVAEHEARRVGRALLHESFEPQRVDLQSFVAQHDRVAVGHESRLADLRSQPPHRLIERVPGLRSPGLRPEHAHQMGPGPPAVRGQRKIHKEREVLAAQQLWRRGAPVEARARHAKTLQLEEREVRHVRCRRSKIPLNLPCVLPPSSPRARFRHTFHWIPSEVASVIQSIIISDRYAVDRERGRGGLAWRTVHEVLDGP